MLTIRTMSAPAWDESTKLRYEARAKLALDNLVAELKASGRLRFNGKKISQEALVNASWIWMQSLDLDELERQLAPHVARLESMMGITPDRPVHSQNVETASSPPKKPPGKQGG